MRQRLSKRMFHITMVIVIIIAVSFIALVMAVKYDTSGETNMPFSITKISIISTVDGQNVENSSNKWELQVSQNNDIYIYVEKNENYSKTEVIDNITIDNFQVLNKDVQDNIEFYKPSNNTVSVFENKDEYKVSNVEYIGDLTSNMQNMKISNQGGIVAFRCSNINIGTYISNEDDEIQYNKLLSKLEVSNERLKEVVSFDMVIKLNSNVSFKATNIKLEIPVDDIVEKGTTSRDIVDLENVVFKRLEN